ncbi:flagellar motor protein MotB [Roseivivax sp. CAU 1753]
MSKEAIVIKRVEDDDHDGHHGGGWKVAYADFMTAMMAFFLLLWIVSAADADKLKGLAEHFTPVLSQSNGGGPEILDGHTLIKSDTPNGGGAGADSDLRVPSYGEDNPLLVFDSRLRNPKVEEIPKEEVPEPTSAGTSSEPADPTGDMEDETDAQRDLDFAEIQEDVEQQLRDNGLADRFLDNLRFSKTTEGLDVHIVDQPGEAMFASGSARINNETRLIIEGIAKALEGVESSLVIAGHTDALPFTSEGYDNWDLSSERANATRRVLVAAGLEPMRIAGVSGLADTEPLLPERPDAPDNRRVSITVLYPES